MDEKIRVKPAGRQADPPDDFSGIVGVKNIFKAGNNKNKSWFSFFDHGESYKKGYENFLWIVPSMRLILIVCIILFFLLNNMPDLFDGGRFDLPDPFAGNAQDFGDLGQCIGITVFQSKA